ncbi:MAG TPA: cysteine desulfurase family protein [Candidatus Nanoarchaeia archaeon]|nr:cysteine desulfurase family protein [Candidatus Nanoarchaeia archaeon]
MKYIYLDNASTTQMDLRVVEAMQPYFTEHYGNPNSAHTFGEVAFDAVEISRAIIAKKIGAHPSEIAFTGGGTESNNMAIFGSSGDVVTTSIEHKSISEACRSLRGRNVSFAAVDPDGLVDFDSAEKHLTTKTGIVSVIHGQNEIGTVQDLRRIGKICSDKNVLFHVDACQSFLKEPINVRRMNIDLMTLNGHKIHGPKGVGALYVRDGVQLKPILYGGNQDHGLRAGTQNVPAIVGFGKAASIWTEKNNSYIKKMRDLFMKNVRTFATLNGHRTKRLCSILNYSFGVDGVTLVQHLNSQRIMASTGSACTSHEIVPSAVLKALGYSDERARSSARFSFSRFTTAEDIKTAGDKIKLIVKSLRAL